MNTPKAYILVGVPGSGKSTWASRQPFLKNAVYVSTDSHVEAYAALHGKSYSEVFQEAMPSAVESMTQDVVSARDQSRDIVWDQTSTTILSRAKKFRMLRDYYMIAVMFRTPQRDELERRLSQRPGKVIPWDVVQDMIDRFEEPTEKEGFKEIWYA